MMISKISLDLTAHSSVINKLFTGFSKELLKLEDTLYSQLIRVSKDINELSALIILIDDINFEINLDEFKGLL